MFGFPSDLEKIAGKLMEDMGIHETASTVNHWLFEAGIPMEER